MGLFLRYFLPRVDCSTAYIKNGHGKKKKKKEWSWGDYFQEWSLDMRADVFTGLCMRL